jgi:hypothetical protein
MAENDGNKQSNRQEAFNAGRPSAIIIVHKEDNQAADSETQVPIGAQLRRSSTTPAKHVVPKKNDLTSPTRSLSLKRKKVGTFESAPYYSGQDAPEKKTAETPGFTNVPLTVINTITTPTPTMSRFLSPTTPVFKEIKILDKDQNVQEIKLARPNQFRAFAYKALNFQKRQWFNNVFCLFLCPFLMIFLSFLLKIMISKLAADDMENDFGKLHLILEILYCSENISLNQQNWPIYNISGVGIARLNASQVPFAKKKVRAVNYLSRLSMVDLAGRDPIAQLASAAIAGSLPCVQWFGQEYPTGDNVYAQAIQPLNGYSTKDSYMDFI